jgi:hypothetical protein
MEEEIDKERNFKLRDLSLNWFDSDEYYSTNEFREQDFKKHECGL